MIYLLRHGLDNEDYIGGYSDIDLIDLGVKQVKKSSLFIRNNLEIDNIISSDIKRCVSTSKIVRDSYYKHLPIYLDSSLRELDKGILTGRERKGLTEYEREIFNNDSTNIKISITVHIACSKFTVIFLYPSLYNLGILPE